MRAEGEVIFSYSFKCRGGGVLVTPSAIGKVMQPGRPDKNLSKLNT